MKHMMICIFIFLAIISLYCTKGAKIDSIKIAYSNSS
jgi:hypothetical protein